MKSLLVLVLSFGLNFSLLSQTLVDITGGGSYAFTNTTNVISTNFGGSGLGIGWCANLYSDAEMGPTNELLSLRWMIDYAATTAGDSYTMNNVSIWLFESGTNTVFPSIARPDLIANDAVNVFQGDLVFTPPAQSTPNHCEADVQFTTPFQYSTGNSLVVYVEKLTPYVGGPVSPYYGYMPGASGLRVLSNWSGTVADPLLPNANNSQQDRYALIKFNETDPADLCTQSPCDPGAVSGSTTLCTGTNEATVSISNPNNGNIQWQQLVNGIWEDIPGANSNSLTVNNLVVSTQYQAIVSSSACSTATSANATITVSPIVTPPEIGNITQPICPATTGSISFINLPTPGAWSIIGDPGGEIITGSGTTGLMENLSPDNYSFSLNWNGCSSEFSSEIATIETPQTATPISTSNDFTACLSDQSTVNDLPVSFTGTPTIELESVPGFTPVLSTDLLVNGNYYISQTDNTNGCIPSDTIIITVSIEASQVPEISNATFTFCEAEIFTVADLGATGNGGTLSYYFSNGSTITAVNTTDLLQSGAYFVTQTGPANTCESIDSLEITVTIGTTPTPTTSEINQTFCVTDNALVSNLDIDASTNTLNYFFDNGTSVVSVDLTDMLLAGNYFITASDPNTNCSSTDSLLITVTLDDTAAPNTTANSFEACIADLAAVNDLPASFTGTPNIFLEISPGFISVIGTDLLVSGNYYLTQTNPVTGCSSSDSAMISVSIQASQIPAISNAIFTICESEIFTVADLGATGNGGTLNYYFSNGSTITAVNTTDLLQTGTYFVTQIGPANTCESIDSLEITVTIGTTPTPTTSEINQVFCVTDNALVSDLVVDVSTNTLNYFFENGISVVSVNLTDVLLAGNYFITATDPNTNCSSTDSLLITIILDDTPAPTANTTNQVFCATDEAIISDLQAIGENIQWYDASGNLLSQSSVLLDNTSYFATQTEISNGCESSSNLEISVTISDPPAPLSNFLTQYFCETENPTIADILVIGSNIQWYDTEINGLPLNASAALIDGQTYFASQVITGCESSSFLAVTINIQNVIDGSFFASESLGCSPFNVQLTPNFINPNASYSWYIDGVFSANSTILDYTFSETGCYDIQLTIDEQNSCATDITNSDFICVSPSPTASFYTNPNSLTINDQLVSFQNTSSNADSFIWDFGNGNTSTQTSPETNINIINETQTITLTAIADNGCGSIASITFDMPEYDLYVPNSFTPDADEHNQSWGPVFLSGFDKFNFEVLVFNRWGEVVWESKDADGRWDGKYSNKQLTCPEGIYTWKITYKKKNSDDRIVRTGHINLIR